jgi:hypothetical protein
MSFTDVNLVAVLVAAVAAFVFGSLWYSPLLFGNVWKKLAGVKKGKLNYMWLRFLVYLLATLVMAFVLAHFLAFAAAITVVEGLITAFWLWLGFIVPITLGGILWENKSVKLFALNNVYNLLSLGIIAAILIAWK